MADTKVANGLAWFCGWRQSRIYLENEEGGICKPWVFIVLEICSGRLAGHACRSSIHKDTSIATIIGAINQCEVAPEALVFHHQDEPQIIGSQHLNFLETSLGIAIRWAEEIPEEISSRLEALVRSCDEAFIEDTEKEAQ